MRITGFDSAWGGRAPGALCEMDSVDGSTWRIGTLETATWARAVEAAGGYDDDWHVIAIDQGLVVPNSSGMRPVEKRLMKALMGPFKCGAHASNTSNLGCYGPDAGIWRYLEELDSKGFLHEPMAVLTGRRGRYYFECYPHPAFVGLFGLPQILRYKVRTKDGDGWRNAIELVQGLGEATPRIENVRAVLAAEGIAPDSRTKKAEDKLDAIVCAYVAAHAHAHGPDRSMVLGDLATGYMVTPVSEAMRTPLEAVFDEDVNPAGRARWVKPTSDHAEDVHTRAAVLLDELARAADEGVPEVYSYKAAFERIFEEPYRGQGHADQVSELAKSTSVKHLSSLVVSGLSVHLDAFIVNAKSKFPGAGHWATAAYSEDEWRAVFAEATLVKD